jgi:HAMP domain-containing protein
MAGGETPDRVVPTGLGEARDLLVAVARLHEHLENQLSVVRLLASGDLSTEVVASSEQDAFGNALGRMVASLRDSVREVTTTSEKAGQGVRTPVRFIPERERGRPADQRPPQGRDVRL